MERLPIKALRTFAIWNGEKCEYIKCNAVELVSDGGIGTKMFVAKILYDDECEELVGVFKYWDRAVILD